MHTKVQIFEYYPYDFNWSPLSSHGNGECVQNNVCNRILWWYGNTTQLWKENEAIYVNVYGYVHGYVYVFLAKNDFRVM